MKLVHVLPDSAFALSRAPRESTLDADLAAQAGRLGTRFGIEVDHEAIYGDPAETLVEIALDRRASLIVVGALGSKAQPYWLVGSVAERVAQCSAIPALVVRDPVSIEAWVKGEGALRVTVGVDLGESSLVALHWVETLRHVLPCDVCVAQIAWPISEFARLGIKGPIELEGLRPGVQETLESELRTFTGKLTGQGQTRFVVNAGWGRVDSHLARLAQRVGTDLLVVGTHQRAWAARVWQGSISRGAIHHAESNVACIPAPRAHHDVAFDAASAAQVADLR